MSLEQHMITLAKKAREASYEMALVPAAVKKDVLLTVARALVAQSAAICRANAKDLAIAKDEKYSTALIDRLTLNHKRIVDMAEGVRQTALLEDPIGTLLETRKRPNGLLIKKIQVPLGVVGIIFESRPNVTSDCAALCFKSGNAAILKGGREAFYSNQAIYKVWEQVLKTKKMPKAALQLVPSTDRDAVKELLKLDQYIDVIVPRGGESLIRFVAENSSIPVVKHYKGVCHVYVSDKADLAKAAKIVMNAKVQKPGVCNAMETLLVHEKVAAKFLPTITAQLINAGCTIKGDEKARRLVTGLAKATKEDWYTEYLELILNVGIVATTQEAITHINHYGSHHSDSIVTKDSKEADQFMAAVDSACVYVNASTRFTDGFEFGFGAEVGISTDKLHVRGPMALDGLTSYKYKVYGNGQVRQ